MEVGAGLEERDGINRSVRRVVLFGAYDLGYSRTQTIIQGIRDSNLEVVQANFRSSSLVRQVLSQLAFLVRYRSTAFDIILVPHPGFTSFPAAWLVSRAREAPLVFDYFISLYETRVEERREFGRLQARLALHLDRLVIRSSTVLLVDTEERRTHMPARLQPKTFTVPVSSATNPRESSAVPAADSDVVVVLWYGTYAPLHGVDTILEAARQLQGTGQRVLFRLIGDPSKADSWTETLQFPADGNVVVVPPMPYAQLAREIRRCHIALGIFGTTPKAQEVIPNKVVDALAAGRPVITGDTPAVRRALVAGREVVTVPCGNAGALAEAIARLAAEPDTRDRLGKAARSAFESQFSGPMVASSIGAALRFALDSGK